MKQMGKHQAKLFGLTGSIMRFSLTAAFLLASAVLIAVSINEPQDIYAKLIISFLLGALLGMVSQVAYERFFQTPASRWILMGVDVILSGIYFLILLPRDDMDMELSIRTAVIMFALFIAFLWVPVINHKHTFNESFIAMFKAFFISVFYSGVLFLGVVLILGAVDILIISVDEKLYLHAANIIFAFFAPMYLLSMIPVFSKKESLSSLTANKVNRSNPDSEVEETNPKDKTDETRDTLVTKVTGISKFLETLISYVIIPITAVFTIILLLYILMNITGDFWTDNLLEPMLVSYSITVIIVYLLASGITNALAGSFRKIFPKVLVPIVLFQTISSILKISESGITFGRYYVILFGIFATAAGILFCILPIRKNGVIAPILLVLSMISILPPIDAFTISRMDQTSRLEKTLRKYNMIEDNSIIPNSSVSKEDRQRIAAFVRYMDRMDYIEETPWLSSYAKNSNFEKTFGFTEYELGGKEYSSKFFDWKREAIPVAGYDFILQTGLYNNNSSSEIGNFEKNKLVYSLSNENKNDSSWDIVLKDEKNKELLRYSIQALFAEFEGRSGNDTELTTEEATFTLENENAVLTLIIERININEWQEGKEQSVELYILVRIK